MYKNKNTIYKILCKKYKYVLHNLQGQLLGFQFLIKFLKSFSDFNCFNCNGTVFHITGPKYLSVHFPYNSVLTFGIIKSYLERK